MPIQTTTIKHDVFGNCVKIMNGQVELLVTVDFGPRVIHCSLTGMENMFYEDKEKKPLGEQFDVYDGDINILYGGHRLWLSPEILPRCYHPDNKPVSYIEIKNGMSFTAAIEEKNGIQKILNITLSEDKPRVIVEHIIRNVSFWNIEFAPWCLTMLDKGGKEVLPFTKRETGLLHNRSISLWDYSEMNDSRVYWGKNYITLTQDEAKTNPFKLGYNNEEGWAAYFNKGQVFIKNFKPVVDGWYPDNGCSYETFTNGVMLESETLGELSFVEPGDEIYHIEEWELYKEEKIPSNCENEIKELMSKYITGRKA